MTGKPRSGELSRGAKEFVRENFAYLKEYAMPLFVPMLVAAAMQRIGEVYSNVFVFAGALLTCYLTACFMLAWHRAALLGPKPQHIVHPFALKPGEGKFIGVFFSMALVMMLAVILGIIPGILLGVAGSPKALAAFLAVIFAIVAMCFSMRFMFMLPARAVNSQVTWSEGWHIGKGMIWRLFAASFRTNIWLGLLVALLTVIVAGVLFATGQASIDEQREVQFTLMGAIMMFLFSGVPALLVNFIVVARGVTVLSRLYQWSVQNQPAEVSS